MLLFLTSMRRNKELIKIFNEPPKFWRKTGKNRIPSPHTFILLMGYCFEIFGYFLKNPFHDCTSQIFKMWQIFSTEKRFWARVGRCCQKFVHHWKALMRFSLTSKEQSAQMVGVLGGLLEKVWSFFSIVFCLVFCFNQVYKRDFITLIKNTNIFLLFLFIFGV